MYLSKLTFNYDSSTIGLSIPFGTLNLELNGSVPELKRLYNIIIGNYKDGKNMDEKYLPNLLGINENKNNIKTPIFGGAYFNQDNELVYIKKVIYNDPATIVFWNDGTKTVSKCAKEDTYNAEMGLTLAIMKKLVSNEFVSKTLHDWVPVEGQKVKTLTDVRNEYKNK